MTDPARPPRTSVVVVDDQELVRIGFRLILERAGLAVLGEAADGIEAVEVVGDLRPDVVLMDIRMPRLDGVEATRRIGALPPPVPRVLVLTTFDLDEYVYEAVRAGASGFLLKDVSPDDLVHAVRVVARGESMLAPALITRLLDRFTARPGRGTVGGTRRADRAGDRRGPPGRPRGCPTPRSGGSDCFSVKPP